MADPYALKAYGPEELLKRLGLNDTEDDDENKCSVCKNLDGTGKKYRYYERNASSVTTRYYDLLLSGNLGCTFCGWLAYAIAAQAYYELAVPNAQVQVRFGADRSVQIHEVDAAKSKEHLIILEMFTPNGYSPLWNGLGHRPHRCPDPGSVEGMDIIRTWVAECAQRHRECANVTHPLPKRVIDLGPEGSGLAPRLYESNLEHENYIALSHRWGTEQGLRALRQNVWFLSVGLKTRSLPKTFRDAIIVTRALGVRYLWIDSLCIIQDDPLDWQIESSKMCDIYANSFLTIVAAGSFSDAQGFLAPRVLAPTVVDIAPQEGNVSSTRIVIRRHGHSGPPEPLFDRAWTYQERFLSRRMILYKQQEMEWHCQLGKKCECQQWMEEHPWRNDGIGVLGMKDRDFHFDHNRLCNGSIEDAQDTWRKSIVPKYSRLSLTKATDRLPALSGIAKLVHTRYPENTYLAGLWAMDLPQGLLWMPADPKPAQASSERAPSWCWPSIEAPIKFSSAQYSRFNGRKQHILIEVLTAKCIPSGSDPHGCVKAGSLRAKAPLLQVKANIIAPRETDKKEFEDKYSYTFQRDEDPVVHARGPMCHPKEQFHPDTPIYAVRNIIALAPPKFEQTLRRWVNAPACVPQCVQGAYVWIMFVMSEELELKDRPSHFIYHCLVLGHDSLHADIVSFKRLGYWKFSSGSGAARWLEAAELTTLLLV